MSAEAVTGLACTDGWSQPNQKDLEGWAKLGGMLGSPPFTRELRRATFWCPPHPPEVEVTDDAGLGPDFREAALATVGDWSFLPASREGVEVACWAQFPIGFAPPLPPEEQRRIDSLAALTGATGLAVDSQPALPVLVGDSAATAASFFEVDQVDTEPVLTVQVEPDYPTPALISRDTCTVAMRSRAGPGRSGRRRSAAAADRFMWQ